jgi:ribosome-associated translation inhibitor RaiA
MVKLEAGNVLLKPSHRRQLMGWLKRASRLGQRLGDFDLTITIARVGRQHEVTASVHDAAGDFRCRSRQRDWRDALRDLIQRIVAQLHMQRIRLAAA